MCEKIQIQNCQELNSDNGIVCRQEDRVELFYPTRTQADNRMLRMNMNRLLVLAVPIILSLSASNVDAGIPVPEEFFPLQNIDHLDPDEKGLWTQRYYTYGKHFKGPGHPIFLILGGEGAISPETGIFYPFVADHLAKTYGGFVLQPEHRFYGKSQPLQGKKKTNAKNKRQ